jgi:hypothetical protein
MHVPIPPKRKGPSIGLVLLILFGVVALVAGLGIAGFVLWLRANKDRLAAEGRATMAEGRAYAASHDQRGCLDEGLRRLDKCGARTLAFGCEIDAHVFTDACILPARPTAGLCDGVPRKEDIGSFVSWSMRECIRRGHEPSAVKQGCTHLMESVADACHRPEDGGSR